MPGRSSRAVKVSSTSAAARSNYEKYIEFAPAEMADRKNVENKLRQMDRKTNAL